MNRAVVIPWRGGDPDRELHHQVVRDHLTRILPDAIHLDVDDGADPFSRAGSRNYGVRLAENAGADVIALVDADTLPEPGPLHEAIQGAAGDGRLHWWQAGGMDEAFTGWGFEDTAFRICADALLGPTARHPGTITHLWHPSAVGHDTEQHRRNAEHHRAYEAAEGNPDAIRRLITERITSPQVA